jgi:hypothetical protein
MKTAVLVLTSLCTLAPAAFAQSWEVGGGGGGSFTTSADVTNPALSGQAKIGVGFAAGAWLANNITNHWGGEIRYDLGFGDLQLTSGGTKASFSGQTHAIHYDFAYHFQNTEAPFRPYVSFGGGMKLFRGTGTEVASQPLNNLALLTRTNDLRPLVSVGAGIKINARKIGFRIEARDNMSPFPDKVIAPAQNSSVGGWLHELVVFAGICAFF